MRQSQTSTAGRDTRGGWGRFGVVGIQATHDPCHWERTSQPWEVLATPLDARPFHNRKVFVGTPDCILYCESFASRIRARVLSPDGMLAISIPVRLGSRTHYFNRPTEANELPAMLPGAAEATLDAGQQQYMILIRLTLLRRLLAEPQWAGLERAAANHRLDASAQAQARLAAWLDGLLARVHREPTMLNHHAAVEALERELVQGLSDALRIPAGRERPAPSSVRCRGFERAIEHIRYAELGTLSQPGLASAAGVSRRTLEYAFQERLGLSPSRFIRLLRLHGLRRELLVARFGESTVTDMAYHLGFTQLGRLARDYRVVFGESPSATLARPFRDDAPRFWDPAFDPAQSTFLNEIRTPWS